MSTIYSFNEECPALDVAAPGDVLVVHDVSAGRTKKMTLSQGVPDTVTLSGTSTGTASMTAPGTYVFTGTSTSVRAVRLGAPFAGATVVLAKPGTSTQADTVTGTTVGGITGIGNGTTIATFVGTNQGLVLKGINSTQWVVASNAGTVTLS